MSAAWKSFPGAPEEGTAICPVAALTAPVQSFDLEGFPLLLVQSAEGLRGYINACPHQYLPLDWRSSDILSADGGLIRCSNHDAGFDATTGQGVDGLGQGCELDRVPVYEEGGELNIGHASG